jgi:hypothetical protein
VGAGAYQPRRRTTTVVAVGVKTVIRPSAGTATTSKAAVVRPAW